MFLCFGVDRYVRLIDSHPDCGLLEVSLMGGIMTSAIFASLTQREPELLEQTVVVIGGSAGIGLETARRARAQGAKLILTGRSPERLQRAASQTSHPAGCSSSRCRPH